MINFFQKIRFFVVVGMAAVMLSGCGTNPVHTRSTDEILEMRNSRLYRLRVDWVASQESEEWCISKYTDEEWQQMHPDMTKEEARNYRTIAGRWYRSYLLGAIKRAGAAAHVDMNVEKGDIVDIYAGAVDPVALRENRAEKLCGITWVFSSEQPVMGKGIPQLQTPVVLGIVCKHHEEGCEYDTSPETQIGIGRYMTGPGDYQGVEAESKQPMYKGDTTWEEWLSINHCFNCNNESAWAE